MTRRGFLYRIFAADGELLYVGSTGNVGQRFANHASRIGPWWWPMAAGYTVEEFQTLDEARRRERQAIAQELPRYNRQHRKLLWRDWPREEFQRFIDSLLEDPHSNEHRERHIAWARARMAGAA